MKRWLGLIVIGMVVLSGIQGCVFVVADEDTAREVREERQRSAVARAIARDIGNDEQLVDSDIHVTERDGRVMLRGDVDSLTSLSRAIAIAVERDDVRQIGLHVEVALPR